MQTTPSAGSHAFFSKLETVSCEMVAFIESFHIWILSHILYYYLKNGEVWRVDNSKLTPTRLARMVWNQVVEEYWIAYNSLRVLAGCVLSITMAAGWRRWHQKIVAMWTFCHNLHYILFFTPILNYDFQKNAAIKYKCQHAYTKKGMNNSIKAVHSYNTP